MKYTKIVKEDVDYIIEACGGKNFADALRDKRVYVAGASGMLGSYFCYSLIGLNELYDAKIKIVASIHNVNHLDRYIAENSSVEVIIEDIAELSAINEEGAVDFVIHAASPASPKVMKNAPVMTNLANSLGAARLLDLAERKKSRGFLFVSSREIYGEPNEGQNVFSEDGPYGQVDHLIPRNGYAEGKKAAENLCAAYREEYSLNAKVVRLAHTYGPGMSITDGRVQADFLNNVIHGEDIVLKSDGSSIRTYTYVADAVVAMLRVLVEETKDFVYNVADERNEVSIKQLAEIVAQLSDGSKLVFNIPKEQKNTGTAAFTRGILSTERIRGELGWEAKYSVKDGFARTIEHLRKELAIEYA